MTDILILSIILLIMAVFFILEILPLEVTALGALGILLFLEPYECKFQASIHHEKPQKMNKNKAITSVPGGMQATGVATRKTSTITLRYTIINFFFNFIIYPKVAHLCIMNMAPLYKFYSSCHHLFFLHKIANYS